MQLPKMLFFPAVDDIKDIETAKEFLRQLINILEEMHNQIFSDLKELQTKI